MARDTRPRWRTNETSFVGHALVEAGTEVFYTPTKDDDGRSNGVSANLSPLNDEAQAIVEEQKRDHPDKKRNADKRAAAALVAETAEEEDTVNGGLVPRHQRKGDTRTDEGADDEDGDEGEKKPKGRKKKPAATDAADDAEDVG